MRTTHAPIKGLLLLACAIGATTIQHLARAEEDPLDSLYDITMSSGFDFVTGKYGTDTGTDIWYIPFTTKLEGEKHSLKLTVPYLSITDSGSVVGGGDQVIVVGDGEGGERKTEDGLGDIIGVFSYYLYPGTEVLPMVDLNYKLKVPTADKDRGLGTGEFDHSIEIDIAKAWGRTTVFTTGGYKIFGDPEDYELNDVFYGSVGAQYKVNDYIRTGLIYDIRDNTTDTGDGISEITGYLGRDLNDKWKIMVYGVAGLSDGSPDWGAGITFTRVANLRSLSDLFSF
jgi:hypothetical protein